MIYQNNKWARLLGASLVFMITLLTCFTQGADIPAWWQTRGVIQTNAVPNDYAALNAGQLTHLAFAAWQELDTLPGGAGFQPTFTNAANNYSAVNIGQLKAVARPFYDRLITLGSATNYPWSDSPSTPNYSIANIGQAKALFSFVLIRDLPPDSPLDSDGDGMSDEWEMANGLDPFNNADAEQDMDGDGLINVQEFLRGTDPYTHSDSDGDGMPDGWEVSYDFNPLDAFDAGLDSDNDGLTNLEEYQLGTNPYNPDTDGDGLSDAQERPNVIVNERFPWFDVSGGTNLLLCNYTQPKTVNLPFPVWFDGVERTQATIGFNGWLALLTPGKDQVAAPNYSNPAMYKVGADHVYILGCMTDTWNIDLLNQSIVLADVSTNGNRYCVIEYRADVYTRYNHNLFSPLTFQIVIPFATSNQVTTSFLEINNDMDCCLAVQSPETMSRAVYSYLSPYFIPYNSVYSGLSITYHLMRTATAPLNPDTDGDGMPDKWEWGNGLNPRDATDAEKDLDWDELKNLMEYRRGTNPCVWDTDGDGGIGDGLEVRFGFNPLDPTDVSPSQDRDSDGIPDIYEYYWYNTDPLKQDTDGDRLLDGDEVNIYHTSPTSVDTDGDWLSDGVEVNRADPLDPKNTDTDGDGLKDGEEVYTYGTNPKFADTDGDGISDKDEIFKFHTDPTKADTDGDGLSDGLEVNELFTNPRSVDTDWDSLSDYDEYYIYYTSPSDWDSDGDGLSDGSEICIYGTSVASWDTDGDGLSDGDEVHLYRTDPMNQDSDGDGISDGQEVWDTDQDGLSDQDELLHGTDFNNPDSDGDGMPDGWEVRYALNPLDPSDAVGDPDRDGLTTIQEFTNDTDPLNPDTDADGLSDGEEIVLGTLPKMADTDGDRMPDGWEVAHAIEGFDPLNAADGDLDPDNDGLRNWYECLRGTTPNASDTDGNGIPDWDEFFSVVKGLTVRDNNCNGLSDEWENLHWTIAEYNPYYYINIVNPVGDPDNDGVDNLHEYQAGTDPTNLDTDGDGISDRDELFIYYTSPTNPDTDGDGLSDYEELFVYYTNALVPDMDGDGLLDGEEIKQFNTNPALFSSDGSGMSDLWLFLGGQIPAEWPALSAPVSGGTVPVTLSTYLDSASPDAVGLLRIGDNFIHVQPGDPVEITLSLPVTGRSLFTFVPGPRCTTADKPVITVTASSRLAVFSDPGNLIQVLDPFALRQGASSDQHPAAFVGGAIEFPPFTVTPSKICSHDPDGTMLRLQSSDPKVRFLVGNSLLLSYSPRPPKKGEPVTSYITYADPRVKIFHTPIIVDYCHCKTPDDPSDTGASTDCFCNCCHVCCHCWDGGCTCTPGNCTCQVSCNHDSPPGCSYCGATGSGQSGDPLQCDGCFAPNGNCHDDPECRCVTCPLCAAHRCDYAFSVCYFDEYVGHCFGDPYSTDESTCTCRDIPHAYECPCTKKYPDALQLCPCEHRYKAIDDRGHKVLCVGKFDTIGVVLPNGTAPCPNCQHSLSCSSGCNVVEKRGPISVSPGARSTSGDFIISDSGLSTQIGDAFVACKTLGYSSGGSDVTYILQCYTVLGLNVYPTRIGNTVEKSPYWLQQVMPQPPSDPYLLSLKFNDRNAITFDSKIKLPGDCGTITIESTGAGSYLYIKNQLRNSLSPFDPLLTPEKRSATFSLGEWKKTYCDTLGFSRAHLICPNSGVGSIKITFNTNSGQSESICVSAEQKFTAVKLGLVPDYDRDGKILEADCNLAKAGKEFSFWVNDDKDDSDFTSHGKDTPSTDFPGQPDGNGLDTVVNGRSDLIDFTPVWLDLKEAMSFLPPGTANRYRIRSRGVKAVQTRLPRTGDLRNFAYLANEQCGPSLNQPSYSASVIPTVCDATEQVAELSPAFLAAIQESDCYGVIMVEGAVQGASLKIEVLDESGLVVFSSEAPLLFVPVESMYRWINLRGVTGGSVELPTSAGIPRSVPDSECNGKHFIFVHGLNVNEHDARCSGAEMFKRLYHSGSKAMYTAVAWYGTQGQTYYNLPGVGRRTSDYYANVVNAFNTASALAVAVGQLPGSKIIAAHSLGNMVVSSAIQDRSLVVEKYFMLNAAMASETLDEGRFNKTASANPMVHDEWRTYESRTWASCWHELFIEWADDGRGKLTWENRFSGVRPIAYNYYSSGDEAFETYANGTPSSGEGYDGTQQGTGRYSWSKQELYKGRNNSDDAIVSGSVTGFPLGSYWAGWGFDGVRTYLSDPISGVTRSEWTRSYDAATANGLPRSVLMASSPVFYPNPPAMFNATIDPDTQNRILAYGIPALSTTIGHERVGSDENPVLQKEINMNALNRPNGWWRPKSTFGEIGERWLHSDMFEVAYCYVYKVFDDFADKGALR